jgi:putative SOS response-associated peptidase YedK
MCSRFALSAAAAAIAARFGIALPVPAPARARGNPEIRPTDPALTIGPDGAQVRRWGLARAGDARPLINARAETLAERPTFRRLLGARVLVPATRWWEWVGPGRSGVRTRFVPEGLDLFAFAGLAEGDYFTIVTCASPWPDLHPRMPVVLTAEGERTWLDGARPWPAVAACLRPWPGSVRHDPEEEGERTDACPSPQGDLFL